MIATPATDKRGYRYFSRLQQEVYRENPYFRATEASVEEMLICGPTAFHRHAQVKPFLLWEDQQVVGRFALIHDKKRPELVQVAFFEALPDLEGIQDTILEQVDHHFPQCSKYVVGLNGHLNYGAGLLLDHFREPPVFGFPYSQPYYPAYFRDVEEKKMVSFQIPIKTFHEWSSQYAGRKDLSGLTLRFMDKRQIRRDVAIYTWLNNQSFQDHPYWADRAEAEDYELFYPFRFLLNNENMVIAEYHGQPVGFFLWYPDFNQLVHSQRDLNVWDVLRFRLKNGIDTCRFTEIGVVPQFQGSPVPLAMIDKAFPFMRKAGYKYCEAGFIFEENRRSLLFTKRIMSRCGLDPTPHRQFSVYEGVL
jgi:GNAT superfamily N-acetyltransferase